MTLTKTVADLLARTRPFGHPGSGTRNRLEFALSDGLLDWADAQQWLVVDRDAALLSEVRAG